jgi:hypothetical protein
MFIGEKEIKEVKEAKGKTIGGNPIMEVKFTNGDVQHFSKLMYDRIVSEEKCDLTQLREKRLTPVLEIVLAVLRDWGVTSGELPYFSIKLNQSLDYNTNQALIKLVSKYMPTPKSLDDIDYITIDRILSEEK